MVGWQAARVAFAENQLLQARLALLALGDADHAHLLVCEERMKQTD